MRTLKAQIDLGRSEMKLFDEELVVPPRTSAAGQFVVYLLGQSEKPELQFEEVMQTEIRSDVQILEEPEVPPSSADSPSFEESSDASVSSSPSPSSLKDVHDDTQGPSVSVWSRVDQGLKFAPITGKQGEDLSNGMPPCASSETGWRPGSENLTSVSNHVVSANTTNDYRNAMPLSALHNRVLGFWVLLLSPVSNKITWLE
eukprot:s475_g10.t1